jgi:hypothetical protein
VGPREGGGEVVDANFDFRAETQRILTDFNGISIVLTENLEKQSKIVISRMSPTMCVVVCYNNADRIAMLTLIQTNRKKIYETRCNAADFEEKLIPLLNMI